MLKYKGYEINRTEEGVWYVSDGKSKFIVALDDSKEQGERKFIQSTNNVEACKKYVDWLTQLK